MNHPAPTEAQNYAQREDLMQRRFGFMVIASQALRLGSAVGLTVFMLPIALLGQGTTRSTVVGTVTDPSGAVVSGGKITIANRDTGIEQAT